MPVAGIEDKVLVQICVTVRDVEKMAARYAEVFRFDVPEIQITYRHDHTRATYFGQPTDARCKLVCFQTGQVQFELLQPLEPPSSWKDHLDRHGESIHHLAFFVPTTEVTAASFAECGYVVTQQGLFTGQTGMYTYLDTDKDMGVVIELLEHFGGNPVFNPPPFDANKGIGTDLVCQVGLIVHDIEKTAWRYMEVLGLPEPRKVETPGYEAVQTTYRGQPTDATARLAFFDFGQLQLELIQPDEKPSTWREFLDQKGEGAHHIAFQVTDTKRAVSHFAKYGIPVVQQGFYSDHSGMYTYLDSQALLGTTIELLESFTN
jgi:catechol 2,3-dioxygenase-like lactoylglutathione lyase family enzyme